MAELYQEAGRLEEAIGVIQQLHEADPSNLALKLSLCDLLHEDGDDEGVIETATGVAPVSDLALAILHLEAQSLAIQGLMNAALETFNACLKRTAGLDPALLRDIRYDRAMLYEATNKAAQARREWEKLYADDPKYRDVARRVAPKTYRDQASHSGGVEAKDRTGCRSLRWPASGRSRPSSGKSLKDHRGSMGAPARRNGSPGSIPRWF